LLSDATNGVTGAYEEPSQELNFQNFIASLLAKAIAVSNTTD
jgi:hypothetical protein